MPPVWAFIMNFKPVYRVFFAGLFSLLVACSDTEDETTLVDLHIIASQDVIAINFPTDTTETTLSINSEYYFTVQGLKSNGVDLVTITRDIEWSLSDGAASTIDRQGRFSAGEIAESVTLTAKFGFLSASIDIRVSSAKFDRVIELNEQAFGINMCQSQALNPLGSYVDENGDEEIRPVDNVIINDIEWTVVNKEDESASQRAYIETSNNQPALYTLAAGDIIIRATATSLVSDSAITVDFDQTVSGGLNSIKLCPAGEDINNCEVTSASIEKDQVLSLIAAGNFQAADGSSFNENITRNSQWGMSNAESASIAFSTDRQQLEVMGEIDEKSTTTVSVACGKIEQSLDGIELSQGVTLNIPLSCDSSTTCSSSSVEINIDELSVLSFVVTANDISLTHDKSVYLGSYPEEISLVVKADLSNGSQPDITDDDSLAYSILPIDGQLDVIEKTGTPGVFTVLDTGTAKIQLHFRGESFIAVIEVP